MYFVVIWHGVVFGKRRYILAVSLFIVSYLPTFLEYGYVPLSSIGEYVKQHIAFIYLYCNSHLL